LKKGLAIDPSNADISNRLKEVDAALVKERSKRAKSAPKDLSGLTPSMRAKEEGNELYKNGKFPEAIEVYTRALELASTNDEKITLLNNRAACKFQDRDFKQCVADCNEVLQLDDKNVKALLRRATAYVRKSAKRHLLLFVP
jgi:tetratricopeptide (TPR) repeat protein